jgi:putative endonuclease
LGCGFWTDAFKFWLQQQRKSFQVPKSQQTIFGQAWYVYVIRASDDSLYTGVTTDVERRFKEHKGPEKGARYFRGRQPVEVVYSESHSDRSSAQKREAEIKKLSRQEKLELIGQGME